MGLDLKEYYEHYLSLHQNVNCRRLHFMGQCITLGFVGSVVYVAAWYLLPLALFIVYPFAWAGHYLFEKNKPAAFNNPLKAKLCDWIMFKDILIGKIKI